MKLNWGNGLIIFFVIFFIWVFSFVFFAMRQNIDLMSDDYYQKGADYTDQININKRSVAFQDSVQIIKSANQVQIILSKGLVASGDSVQVYFFRSSDKTKDLRFGFKSADSPFVVNSKQLIKGRYQLYLSWSVRSQKFMVQKALDIE
jgi:hypothetical protein